MSAPLSARTARRWLSRLAALGVALVLALALLPVTASDAAGRAEGAAHPNGPKPTIVLVHGALADASSWNGEIRRLQAQGYPVVVPANPLRRLSSDSDYLRSVLSTIDGPIVLVGHSYGGAVITNAAAGNPNVKSLVYIAALALDEGESAVDAINRYPGSQLTPQNTVTRPYPLPTGGTGTDVYVKPEVFRKVFSADLPARKSAVLAASQRPIEALANEDKSGVPAWKAIPSWYLVASKDRVIPAKSARYMARRAHAHTVEISSSHVVLISHPGTVTRLIVDAANHSR